MPNSDTPQPARPQQGVTADTAAPDLHRIANPAKTSTVPLTRGRHANHAYLVTAVDGDRRRCTAESLLPASALDVLTRMLARERQRRNPPPPRPGSPSTRTLGCGSAVDAYSDAVGTAAETVARHRGTGRASTPPPTPCGKGRTRATRLPHPAQAPRHRRRRRNRPRRGAACRDRVRELDTAHDVAAVLDWRLDTSGEHSTHSRGGPVPWKGAIPATLRERPTVG